MESCPSCGHAETKITEQVFSNNTTHLRVECAKCFKFLRYAPKPQSKQVESFIAKNPQVATMSRVELIELLADLSQKYLFAIDLVVAEKRVSEVEL
jgi:uncharacterized Zn finger protein